MYERDLENRLKRIFGFPKVTYAQPTESREQNVLFVEVASTLSRVTDKKALAQVRAKASIFVSAAELPFGYFAKRIANAVHDDTKDLFFYDVDTNSKYFGDLVERAFSFVFFFQQDYDPNKGTIESVEFEGEQ